MPVFLRLVLDYYSFRGAVFILAGLWLQIVWVGFAFYPPSISNSADAEKCVAAKDNTEHATEGETTCTKPNDQTGIKNTEHVTKQLINEGNKIKEREPTKSKRFSSSHCSDICALIKNRRYNTLVAAAMLSYSGYYTTLNYLPAFAIELDISKMNASILLSIVAGAEIMSRTLIAIFSDKPWFNKELVLFVGCMVCGITQILVTSFANFYGLIGFAFVAGFMGSTIVPQLPPLIGKCVDPGSLGKAVGFAFMLNGIIMVVLLLIGSRCLLSKEFIYNVNIAVQFNNNTDLNEYRCVHLTY